VRATAGTDDASRAELVELARAPGRRSKLLDHRQAAELRAAIDALLERAVVAAAVARARRRAARARRAAPDRAALEAHG
jgi:hypothetical protein